MGLSDGWHLPKMLPTIINGESKRLRYKDKINFQKHFKGREIKLQSLPSFLLRFSYWGWARARLLVNIYAAATVLDKRETPGPSLPSHSGWVSGPQSQWFCREGLHHEGNLRARVLWTTQLGMSHHDLYSDLTKVFQTITGQHFDGKRAAFSC